MVFALALAGYYLRLPSLPPWLEGAAAVWPITLAYAAARQVPHNLWRAFGKQRFGPTDLMVTLIFVAFGPFLAFFFYFYSRNLLSSFGPTLVLLALLTAAALSTRWQRP